MHCLNRLHIPLICLLLVVLPLRVMAQTNKNIQSVPTVAVSADALKIGQSLRHSALEFRQFNQKSIHGHPESIFISNDNREITVFKKFPKAEHILHNIFRFQHDGFWGLADDTGKVIVPPVYRDIWIFEVTIDGSTKTLLWIEIPNPNPKQRQGFRASYQSLIDIQTGITLNKEPMYSLGIAALENDAPANLIAAQPVSADGPHGYMDLRTGEMRIPPKFLYATPFHDERAVVIVTHEHAKTLCKQELGKITQQSCKQPHAEKPPCVPHQMPYDAQACFIAENMEYYGYGVIDTNGSFISRFDYDYIQPFQSQKAVFKRTQKLNNKASLGYMNTEGQEILYGYTEAAPFSQPWATYIKYPHETYDTGWNWIDEQGTVYAIQVDENDVIPPNSKSPSTPKPRLNFVAPFEIQGAVEVRHSNELDTYTLKDPIVSHTGEYISSIIVNKFGHIIWPKHWDNPCTYTYDTVIWPDGACNIQKSQHKIKKILDHLLYIQLDSQDTWRFSENLEHILFGHKQYLSHHMDKLTSDWITWFSSSLSWPSKLRNLFNLFSQTDIFRLWNQISQKLSRIQAYQMPALEAYLSSDDSHYVRIGFGPRHVNLQMPDPPGVYASRHAYGILNADTGRVLFRPGRYAMVQHAIGNLFVFARDGYVGLMDAQENVLIAPRFLDISFILQGQNTENWISNGSQWVQIIAQNLHAEKSHPTQNKPFLTKPKFEQSEHKSFIPSGLILRVSVLDETRNTEEEERIQDESIPVIRFYYDAVTGLPKPEFTDKSFVYRQMRHPILTDWAWDEPQMTSDHWFVERIQTLKRSVTDPEPVYYEVLVDAKGQPAFPNDLSVYSTVAHLHQNTAVIQLQQSSDLANPLELRCLDTQKKAEIQFASFMPSSVREGAACVTKLMPNQTPATDTANTMGNTVIEENVSSIQQQSFILLCQNTSLIEVESCSPSHVTPFIQGIAWIKPKGASTFQRINAQGQIVGSFEIKADKGVFHHGVYRFSTTVPSPENGWKYPEILVSTEGKILWPRDWHKPDAQHFGNIVYP